MASGISGNELNLCTKDNTKRWNYDGLKITAKCVSVYDGDTITVAFETPPLGFFLHNIRLLGIDAPEMKSHDAQEKAAAVSARDAMRALVENKIVELKILSTDKYGRLLANVSVDSVDVSETMLKNKHARPYDGKTRTAWTSEVLGSMN